MHTHHWQTASLCISKKQLQATSKLSIHRASSVTQLHVCVADDLFWCKVRTCSTFIDLTELPSLQLATYKQLPFLSTQDIHASYLEGRIQQHRYTIHVTANLEWEAYCIARIYGIEVKMLQNYPHLPYLHKHFECNFFQVFKANTAFCSTETLQFYLYCSNEYLALFTPSSLLCNFFSSQPSVLMWEVKPLKCEKIFWGWFFCALLEAKRYLRWASSNDLCYQAGRHFTWVCHHPCNDAIIDWVAIWVELIYCLVLCAKRTEKNFNNKISKEI